MVLFPEIKQNMWCIDYFNLIETIQKKKYTLYTQKHKRD